MTTDDGYEFTQDWFSQAPPVWEQVFARHSLDKVLEVGAFEGRATVWVLENLLKDGGRVTCIDTWEGGADLVNNEMDGAERRFLKNVDLAQLRRPECSVDVKKGKSLYELADLLHYGATNEYDMIYIDGSHVAKDVLTDTCMAWPLLRPGGTMVFDDFLWGDPNDPLQRPKPAIDAFTSLFAPKLQLIHVGYQLIVKKLPGGAKC